MLKQIKDILTTREIYILAAIHFDNARQVDIAAELKITQQTVSRIAKESVRLLKIAGIEFPQKLPTYNGTIRLKQTRTLQCHSDYLDSMVKAPGGYYKPSKCKNRNDDTNYKPW